MAIPTSVETAIRKTFIPKLVDNVFHSTYFLEQLWAKKQVQVGGDGFEQPLLYGKNQNVGTYKKYGEYRRVPSEKITKSILAWADYVVTIPFSAKEMRENKGKDGKLINIAKTEIMVGEKSLRDRLASDIYLDGAAYEWPPTSGEILDPIVGIGAIIAEDRSYGGINSATAGLEWWNAHVTDVAGATWTNLVTSSSVYYLPTMMREMIGDCDDGSDEISLIVCPRLIWDALAFVADTKERIEKARIGRGTKKRRDGAWLGFKALYFDDVPVVPDKKCPAGQMNFVNEEHIHVRTLSGATMDYTGVESIPASDGEVASILLSIQMNCSNCDRQGKLTGLPVVRS